MVWAAEEVEVEVELVLEVKVEVEIMKTWVRRYSARRGLVRVMTR